MKKTIRFNPKLSTLALSMALAIGISSSVHAQTVNLAFTHGAPGVNGANGDPGVDGTDGVNGTDLTATVSSSATNTDADNTAQTSGQSSHPFAFGGKGGDGVGTGVNAGHGGNGGNGGGATANASTSGDFASGALKATANANGAQGGKGGNGGRAGPGLTYGTGGVYGNGGNAGDSGNAIATASTTGGTSASAFATAKGGPGSRGGNAGHYGNNDPVGGQSGNGGNGGDAVASVSNVTAGEVYNSARAFGGNGGGAQTYTINPGNQNGHGTFAGNGGTGGNGGVATLGTVYARSTGGKKVTVQGTVWGGSAGSATGGQTGTGNAGLAADAITINKVDGDSDVVAGNQPFDVTLIQNARGGSAGSVTGNGTLGDGGIAYSELARQKNSIATLVIRTDAKGGVGGKRQHVIGSGSNGGIATAISKSENTLGDAGATAVATGGTGGSGGNNNVAGSGNGGQAISSAIGITHTDGSTVNDYKYISSKSDGGDGGAFTRVHTGSVGNGGDAESTARGIAYGNRTINVTSTAEGGDGSGIYHLSSAGVGDDGGNAGSATATAYGENNGDRGVTVKAEATAGRGGSPLGAGFRRGDAGNATATATGNSLSGSLNVAAIAKAGPGGSVGDPGIALARTTATGVAGFNRSTSSHAFSYSDGLVQQVESNSLARVGSTATTASRAAIGSTILDPTAADGESAVGFVMGAPDDASVSAKLAGDVGVIENFDIGGTSEILAFGTMAASSPLDHVIGSSKDYSVDFDMRFDMSKLTTTPQNMLLGLMDPIFTGIGTVDFEVKVENTSLFSQSGLSLTDSAVINGIFGDVTYDLGDWSSIISADNILNVVFNFDLNSDDPGAGLSFDAVFGNSTLGVNAVPVPAAVWLFGSGLIGLMGFRKKKVSESA